MGNTIGALLVVAACALNLLACSAPGTETAGTQKVQVNRTVATPAGDGGAGGGGGY